MKLTKFKHACLVIEKDNATLVVDPGTYTHDFIMPKRVDAVIITHEHPDHLNPVLVAAILKAHPKALLIGHESITAGFADTSTIAATVDQPYTVGPFSLQFFGGTHALIDETIARVPNFGVLIDGHFYYPGDSFTVPVGAQVTTLALPVSAPWTKFDLTADFLAAVNPKFTFPTHDEILSADGRALVDRMVGGVAHSKGILYKRLDGTSIELQV